MAANATQRVTLQVQVNDSALDRFNKKLKRLERSTKKLGGMIGKTTDQRRGFGNLHRHLKVTTQNVRRLDQGVDRYRKTWERTNRTIGAAQRSMRDLGREAQAVNRQFGGRRGGANPFRNAIAGARQLRQESQRAATAYRNLQALQSGNRRRGGGQRVSRQDRPQQRLTPVRGGGGMEAAAASHQRAAGALTSAANALLRAAGRRGGGESDGGSGLGNAATAGAIAGAARAGNRSSNVTRMVPVPRSGTPRGNLGLKLSSIARGASSYDEYARLEGMINSAIAGKRGSMTGVRKEFSRHGGTLGPNRHRMLQQMLGLSAIPANDKEAVKAIREARRAQRKQDRRAGRSTGLSSFGAFGLERALFGIAGGRGAGGVKRSSLLNPSSGLQRIDKYIEKLQAKIQKSGADNVPLRVMENLRVAKRMSSMRSARELSDQPHIKAAQRFMRNAHKSNLDPRLSIRGTNADPSAYVTAGIGDARKKFRFSTHKKGRGGRVTESFIFGGKRTPESEIKSAYRRLSDENSKSRTANRKLGRKPSGLSSFGALDFEQFLERRMATGGFRSFGHDAASVSRGARRGASGLAGMVSSVPMRIADFADRLDVARQGLKNFAHDSKRTLSRILPSHVANRLRLNDVGDGRVTRIRPDDLARRIHRRLVGREAGDVSGRNPGTYRIDPKTHTKAINRVLGTNFRSVDAALAELNRRAQRAGNAGALPHLRSARTGIRHGLTYEPMQSSPAYQARQKRIASRQGEPFQAPSRIDLLRDRLASIGHIAQSMGQKANRVRSNLDEMAGVRQGISSTSRQSLRKVSARLNNSYVEALAREAHRTIGTLNFDRLSQKLDGISSGTRARVARRLFLRLGHDPETAKVINAKNATRALRSTHLDIMDAGLRDSVMRRYDQMERQRRATTLGSGFGGLVGRGNSQYDDERKRQEKVRRGLHTADAVRDYVNKIAPADADFHERRRMMREMVQAKRNGGFSPGLNAATGVGLGAARGIFRGGRSTGLGLRYMGAYGALFGTGALVREYAKGDAEMRRSGVVTRGSAADKIALQKEVRRQALTSPFSEGQLFGASRYMGMAGLDAKTQKSLLNTVKNTALAADISLPKSADLITNIASVTGDLKNVPALADKLTGLFTSTNNSLPQLAQAAKMGLGSARALGLNTDNAMIAMALAGNVGLQGGIGGRTFRSFATSLAKMKPKRRAELRKLGANVFQEDGTLKALPEIFKELGKARRRDPTKLLSLFPNAAGGFMSGILAQLEDQPDLFRRMQGIVGRSQGGNARIAAVSMEGLVGSWNNLVSKIQGFTSVIMRSGGATAAITAMNATSKGLAALSKGGEHRVKNQKGFTTYESMMADFLDMQERFNPFADKPAIRRQREALRAQVAARLKKQAEKAKSVYGEDFGASPVPLPVRRPTVRPRRFNARDRVDIPGFLPPKPAVKKPVPVEVKKSPRDSMGAGFRPRRPLNDMPVPLPPQLKWFHDWWNDKGMFRPAPISDLPPGYKVPGSSPHNAILPPSQRLLGTIENPLTRLQSPKQAATALGDTEFMVGSQLQQLAASVVATNAAMATAASSLQQSAGGIQSGGAAVASALQGAASSIAAAGARAGAGGGRGAPVGQSSPLALPGAT